MKKEKLKKLNNLIYFTKEQLRTLSQDKESTLSTNISRWLKSGDIFRLKNGIYCTKESFKAKSQELGYRELIANILRFPSYVSMEYVLASFDVLTEAIYIITSATSKCSRSYKNPAGTYVYRSLNKELFCGYERKSFLGQDYLIAKKPKALFDYLYFKLDSLAADFTTRNMAEELRLNMTVFTKEDFKQMEKYALIADNKKLSSLIENIIGHASN